MFERDLAFFIHQIEWRLKGALDPNGPAGDKGPYGGFSPNEYLKQVLGIIEEFKANHAISTFEDCDEGSETFEAFLNANVD
jgi:hypothetical protein